MKIHFHCSIAPAKNGNPIIKNPNRPAFDCTELTIDIIAGGVSAYVAGIQVCNGKSGVFTANAIANPAKIHGAHAPLTWCAVPMTSVDPCKTPNAAASSSSKSATMVRVCAIFVASTAQKVHSASNITSQSAIPPHDQCSAAVNGRESQRAANVPSPRSSSGRKNVIAAITQPVTRLTMRSVRGTKNSAQPATIGSRIKSSDTLTQHSFHRVIDREARRAENDDQRVRAQQTGLEASHERSEKTIRQHDFAHDAVNEVRIHPLTEKAAQLLRGLHEKHVDQVVPVVQPHENCGKRLTLAFEAGRRVRERFARRIAAQRDRCAYEQHEHR